VSEVRKLRSVTAQHLLLAQLPQPFDQVEIGTLPRQIHKAHPLADHIGFDQTSMEIAGVIHIHAHTLRLRKGRFQPIDKRPNRLGIDTARDTQTHLVARYTRVGAQDAVAMACGVAGNLRTLSLTRIDPARLHLMQELHGIGKDDLFGYRSSLFRRFIRL
jgi:hypothetical protein